jgi:hypothetical protein
MIIRKKRPTTGFPSYELPVTNYQKRMKKAFSLLTISWAILFYSCTTKGTNWDVDAYAPVAETTMDLTNMIGNDNLQTYGDSSLWLNVDVNAYTFQLDTLTQLPDLSTPYSYTSPISFSFPAGNSLAPFEIPINLSATGTELRESQIKSGFLQLDLKSTNAQRLVFVYSIPAATLGGIPFTFTDTVRGLNPGEDTVYYSQSFNVAGYHLNTTGPNNDQLNTFSAYITVSTIAGDPNMSITMNQMLFKVVNKMVDIVPFYGKGYLGQLDLSQNNITADLDAMRMFRSGVVDIEQLSLWLTVHNTMGAELRFKPLYLKAKNTNSGTIIPLVHSGIGNTVNINRAFETGNMSSPINPVLYTYAINSGNSNIESMVELLPDKIDFSANIQLNPYGNVGGYTDFYYTDYPAYVQMKLQAPLKFSISNLLMVDTIDNPFSSLDLVDNIKDGQFVIRAENKFPLEVRLQLYTLDNAGITTDSLLVNDLIAAAPVNANDRVVNPVISELIATVSPANLQHLKLAKNIRLKAMFNTLPVSSGRMQMYSDYYLKIKLIADIKYNIAL